MQQQSQLLFLLSFSLLEISPVTFFLVFNKTHLAKKCLGVWMKCMLRYIHYMAYLCSYSQSWYKLMCSPDDFDVQTKVTIGFPHGSLLFQLEHRVHSFSTTLAGCSKCVDHIVGHQGFLFNLSVLCYGWSPVVHSWLATAKEIPSTGFISSSVEFFKTTFFILGLCYWKKL